MSEPINWIQKQGLLNNKYKKEETPNKGDIITDTGTRLLNALSTFGGSAIGDVIEGVSPKTADIVEKYSLGLIPHTSKEQLEANRTNNPNKWLNRTTSTTNAISNIATGELIGAGTNKIIPIISNTTKNLSKNNLKTLVYNNITPASYINKSTEIKSLIKDIATEVNPVLKQVPKRNYPEGDFYGLPPKIAIENREDAWKLYLGVGDKGKNLYRQNPNGTYSYKDSRIPDYAKFNFVNQGFSHGNDLLTSNAGGVGIIKSVPTNQSNIYFAKMKDVWDLNPFSDPNRSLVSDNPILNKLFIKPISKEAKEESVKSGILNRGYRKWVPEKFKRLEVGEFLGIGKPFTVEHKIPYKIDISILEGKPIIMKKPLYNIDRILYEKENSSIDDIITKYKNSQEYNNLIITNTQYKK